MKISDVSHGRQNNFNLIRLVCAVLVLYSHSFPLFLGVSTDPLKELVGITWGQFAVNVFFVSSGFLITKSLISRNDYIDFFAARIVRIYPALILSTLITVMALSFIAPDFPSYFSDTALYIYIAKNSFLLFGVQFSLGDMFSQSPYPLVVNGSLWTLPYELVMYGSLVCVSVVFNLFLIRFSKSLRLKHLFLLVFIVGTLGSYVVRELGGYDIKGLELLGMFYGGVVVYLYRDSLILSKYLALLLTLLLLCVYLLLDRGFTAVLAPVVFSYVVIVLALTSTKTLLAYNSLGDYSYGIYIYAFPVQQSIEMIYPGASFELKMLASLVLTSFLAVFSWHCIENPFLKAKDRCYNFIRSLIRRPFLL